MPESHRIIDGDTFHEGITLTRSDVQDILTEQGFTPKKPDGSADTEGLKVLANELIMFQIPYQVWPDDWRQKPAAAYTANVRERQYHAISSGGLFGNTVEGINNKLMQKLEGRAMAEMAKNYRSFYFDRARLYEKKLREALNNGTQEGQPTPQELLEIIDKSVGKIDVGVEIEKANYDNAKGMFNVIHPAYAMKRNSFNRRMATLRSRVSLLGENTSSHAQSTEK